MTKTRRVFGRQRVWIDERAWIFEQQVDGLHMRALSAREEYVLTHAEVLALAATRCERRERRAVSQQEALL